MWVMQRETYGCILHVFKSTFHFWLMITSNARVSYSFPQPLLFFLACCPCFYENCTVWGCTASPGTWDPREMTGVISPPSALVRVCCYFMPSCHVWLKGSPMVSCLLWGPSRFCGLCEGACIVHTVYKSGMLWIISPLLGFGSVEVSGIFRTYVDPA